MISPSKSAASVGFELRSEVAAGSDGDGGAPDRCISVDKKGDGADGEVSVLLSISCCSSLEMLRASPPPPELSSTASSVEAEIRDKRDGAKISGGGEDCL